MSYEWAHPFAQPDLNPPLPQRGNSIGKGAMEDLMQRLTSSPLVLGIVTLSFAALGYICVKRGLGNKKRNNKCPPGPRPEPVIGNLRQFPKSGLSDGFCHWARQYGQRSFDSEHCTRTCSWWHILDKGKLSTLHYQARRLRFSIRMKSRKNYCRRDQIRPVTGDPPTWSWKCEFIMIYECIWNK